MAGRLQGATEASALFEALPSAARNEMADTLDRIGRDVRAAQIARAPSATGALRSEITVQLLTDQLKVRVGLFGPRSKAAFYGRVINGGRKAQTVLVQRRRVGATKLLRNRRKRVEDIVATYRLRVRALAPDPFIDLPAAELDGIATQRIADYWSRALAFAGDQP